MPQQNNEKKDPAPEPLEAASSPNKNCFQTLSGSGKSGKVEPEKASQTERSNNVDSESFGLFVWEAALNVCDSQNAESRTCLPKHHDKIIKLCCQV